MRDLSIDDFSGALGESYEVEAGGGSFALRLDEARPLPQSLRKSGSFALTFRGPMEPILPQGIYPFRRGQEAVEIFICPVGRDDRGTQYEAVFN